MHLHVGWHLKYMDHPTQGELAHASEQTDETGSGEAPADPPCVDRVQQCLCLVIKPDGVDIEVGLDHLSENQSP